MTPTVGRILHYWPGSKDKDEQPQAAIVTFVHADNDVNLYCFDAAGRGQSRQHVYLAADGKPGKSSFAEWPSKVS